MKTGYQIDIISKFRRLREKRGVSQAKMATILGISPGQMGNIESYDKPHKYTLKQMVAICKTLDVSIEEIFSSASSKQSLSIDDFVKCLIKYLEPSNGIPPQL